MANRRARFCSWCNSPINYMPQDRLPAFRRYCDDICARRAWLLARARHLMTGLKALDVAVRLLRRSRKPTVQAAGFALADLRRDLVVRYAEERVVRIAAFHSKLPRAA